MSTNCQIGSGYSLGCRSNTGGISEIYILSGSIDGITYAVPGEDGLISDLSGSGTWYTFELTKQTSDFSDTINASLENGTVFYESILNVAFHKMESSLRNQVKTLAANPDLKIIVKTNNGSTDGIGQYLLMGKDRGATLNGGTGATGTAYGDANSWTLSFQGLEPNPADFIETTGGDLTTALTGFTLA